MARIKIEARKREVTGKAVRHLRAEGWVPAVLYGHGVEPMNLQLDGFELDRVLRETGGGRLVQVEINGETRTVLPRQIQRHPISRDLLHVDLQQVVMTEKITIRVRIQQAGEAPAVVHNRGILVQGLDEVEIRALPEDLIDHLEVDVSSLEEPDDAIRLGDLRIPSGVEVQHDLEDAVVRILPLKKVEELEAELAPAAAEPKRIGKEEEPSEKEEAARARGEKAEKPSQAGEGPSEERTEEQPPEEEA